MGRVVRIWVIVGGGMMFWGEGSWYVKGCGKIENEGKTRRFSRKRNGLFDRGLKGKKHHFRENRLTGWKVSEGGWQESYTRLRGE